MVKTLGCGSGYYFVKKNCTFRFKVEPRAKSLIRYSYEILYCCRRGLERPMNDNYVTCDTGDTLRHHHDVNTGVHTGVLYCRVESVIM